MALTKTYNIFFLYLLSIGLLASGQPQAAVNQDVSQPGLYPYYQSPLPIMKLVENVSTSNNQQQVNQIDQRGVIPNNMGLLLGFKPAPGSVLMGGPMQPPGFRGIARNMNEPPRGVILINENSLTNSSLPQAPSYRPTNPNCLYEKQYLTGLDECLSRKPYPTVGLPAFKNEDLMMQRGLSDKYGCQFILANGLFHNYQLSRFNIDTDGHCLDNSKVRLNLNFHNISLNYMWTLRCLNRADQLLDDATQNGLTNLENSNSKGDQMSKSNEDDSICVGSSQNFGFSSLQLSSIEAQLDLATDIYKNWRITNADVAMSNYYPNGISTARQLNSANQSSDDQFGNWAPTSIRDFTFESLDGDELNWRYLHLYKNWSRNQMHSNFLDQFRRFLWISMQNCLSEASDNLPKKPIEIFGNSKLIS